MAFPYLQYTIQDVYNEWAGFACSLLYPSINHQLIEQYTMDIHEMTL